MTLQKFEKIILYPVAIAAAFYTVAAWTGNNYSISSALPITALTLFIWLQPIYFKNKSAALAHRWFVWLGFAALVVYLLFALPWYLGALMSSNV